ncbi:MAG: iron-containing redox enzyme family protein [Silvibacterium sp.]
MDGPTNSAVLWGKIRLAEGRLFAATDAFWNHSDLARLLPRFLIQAHCLMRSGLTLMSVARGLALQAEPEDTVACDLAAYLRTHLEEELGHDAWLLDDIRTLGFEEREVVQAQPCAAVIDIVGAQYFWMTHVHPVAMMGYLILMEGYAPVASQLEDIRVRSGAPASAFRCLRRHAEDDPEHLAELNRTLDRMNLSAAQTQAVGMCAFAAIEGLSAMFEELLESDETTAAEPLKGLSYARA